MIDCKMAPKTSMDIGIARIITRGTLFPPIFTYCSLPSPPYDKSRLHSCSIFIVLYSVRRGIFFGVVNRISNKNLTMKSTGESETIQWVKLEIFSSFLKNRSFSSTENKKKSARMKWELSRLLYTTIVSNVLFQSYSSKRCLTCAATRLAAHTTTLCL